MTSGRLTKKSALLPALLLATAALAGNPNQPLLLRPLHVRGDRAAAQGGEVRTEFNDDFLPTTFRISVRARSADEALQRLAPNFEQALARHGLIPIQTADWDEIRGLGASRLLRGALLFRCASARDMEQLRARLFFVNQRQVAKGAIRQIFVAITPVPATPYRKASGDLWNDEFGLRIFVAGRPEARDGESLPFDATPLMEDLGSSLAAATR